MKTQTLIEKLQAEAKKSEVAKDLFLAWTVRQRARQVVGLAPLYKRMTADGFTYTWDEYGSVLKFLASVGIGRLDLDPKGKLRGLKDIKLSLQSVGRAAIDGSLSVEALKRRATFGKLDHAATKEAFPIVEGAVVSPPVVPVPPGGDAKTVPPKSTTIEMERYSGPERRQVSAPAAEYRERKPRAYQTAGSNIVLTFLLNEKPINVPVPSDLTKEDIADLVDRFQAKNKEKDT